MLSPAFLAAEEQRFKTEVGSPKIASIETKIFKINVGFLPATEKIDLGTVDASTSYRIRLELVNYTESPLSISKIKTSCGCMKEMVRADPIQTGASGDVHILFEAAKSPGKFGKTASICFNEGCANPLKIHLNGEVASTVTLSPSPLVLPKDQSGIVEITPREDGGPVTELTAEGMKGIASFRNLQRTKHGWRAEVSALPRESWARSGYEIVRIRLKKKDGQELIEDIPIRIDYPTALDVFPRKVITHLRDGVIRGKLVVKADPTKVDLLRFSRATTESRDESLIPRVVNVFRINNGAMLEVEIDPRAFADSDLYWVQLATTDDSVDPVKVAFSRQTD